MNIAIIDADLIGKKKHRFPNLASMKASLKMQKARNKYIVDFEQKFPEFREYIDMKWK